MARTVQRARGLGQLPLGGSSGSGPPQLSSAASSPYSLHLLGCRVPGGERGARCCPAAPSWFRQGHAPLSSVRRRPEEPPLPLSACALAPLTTPFPALDQFVLDMIFTAGVLGLRGRLHFNGGTVRAVCSTGRRSSAAGAALGRKQPGPEGLLHGSNLQLWSQAPDFNLAVIEPLLVPHQ